jgi:hypothetical protein
MKNEAKSRIVRPSMKPFEPTLNPGPLLRAASMDVPAQEGRAA